jgi:hypothetical protein
MTKTLDDVWTSKKSSVSHFQNFIIGLSNDSCIIHLSPLVGSTDVLGVVSSVLVLSRLLPIP